MSTTQAFLFVLAVGGSICGAAWFFSRKRIHRSWRWRAAFCLLVGATIAPTCFRILGNLVVWPAIFMLPLVFHGGKNSLLGIFYGVPPMLFVAAVAFFVWSTLIWRRRRHETTVV